MVKKTKNNSKFVFFLLFFRYFYFSFKIKKIQKTTHCSKLIYHKKIHSFTKMRLVRICIVIYLFSHCIPFFINKSINQINIPHFYIFIFFKNRLLKKSCLFIFHCDYWGGGSVKNITRPTYQNLTIF